MRVREPAFGLFFAVFLVIALLLGVEAKAQSYTTLPEDPSIYATTLPTTNVVEQPETQPNNNFVYGQYSEPVLQAYSAAFDAANPILAAAQPSYNQALCNAADYAGSANSSMDWLKNLSKMAFVPSMIMQLACPKQMVNTSQNEVLRLFTNQGGGLTSVLSSISSMLSAFGVIANMVGMQNYAGMAFGAKALAGVLGGGDICNAMGLLSKIASSSFSFFPPLTSSSSGGGGTPGGTGTPGSTAPTPRGGGIGGCDSASGDFMSIKSVYELARQTVQRYNMNIDPMIPAVIAGTESRYRKISDDGQGNPNYGWPGSTAAGLMQVTDTAIRELKTRGYVARLGLPEINQTKCLRGKCTLSLNFQDNPELAMAYGAAYFQLLKDGGRLTEEDIVRSYHLPAWKNCPNVSIPGACAANASYYPKFLGQKATVQRCIGGG